MNELLNVFDMSRKKVAVLQNAFSIPETQELNKIYSLEFSIPSEDEKVEYLQPFYYVRYGNKGQLYRIIKKTLEDGNTGIYKVSCEHVITTLCDDLMFGTVQYGGGTIKTSDVIIWLLNQQSTKNWVLGTCDFDRKFEYLWEQENILNALFSIPKEFSKAYKWEFETINYPWTLSLKAIDETVNPEYYIRAKSNLLSSGSEQDFADICTRIYPLGYGEGVNQLTIKEATVSNIVKNSSGVAINGDASDTGTTKYGNTYIQSPDNIVAKYGIKQKVLVDRRYEDPNSLFSYAKTTLEALQTPSMSRTFNVVDLYPLTNQNIDDAAPGKICKMTGDGTTAYITKTVRVLDDPGNLSIEMSTKATDVASSIADLADRVRIESVYAQGATQLYQHSKDANATSEKGMVMSLYFPSEMKQINKVLMRLKIGKFRSYSKSTETKTVTVKSCDSPVVTIKSNPSALSGLKTTQAGGGTTSSSGGQTVTVSGGSSSGNSTKEMDEDLDLDVNAIGTISAPTKTQTSEPDPDITTGTKWPNATYSGVYITTEEKDLWTDGGGGTSVTISGKTEDQDASGTTGPYVNQRYYNYTDGADDFFDEDGNPRALHQHMFDHYHILSHEHTVSGSGSSGDHDHTIKTSNRNVYNGWIDNFHDHTISLGKLEHSHSIQHFHTVSISGSASGGKHTHSFSVPAHSHSISEHSHDLPDLTHSHDIQLNSHSHEITLNGHQHEITPGIYEYGNPTGFSISVSTNSGAAGAEIHSTSYDTDITQWLLNDKNQIPRDTWIDMTITPNDLAYVQCSIFVQGFVQSRGGGNY